MLHFDFHRHCGISSPSTLPNDIVDFSIPEDCNLLIRQSPFGAITVVAEIIFLIFVFFVACLDIVMRTTKKGLGCWRKRKMLCMEISEVLLCEY